MCPFLPSWSSSCAAALGTANPWDRTGSFPREERSCGSPVPAQLSGWAAQGRAMLMAHPLPWIYMDLSCPRLELGQGMVSLRFLSLGDGFLHSLCCFPFIPKACGPCLDFPQAMAGRSSLGTAGSCPSVPVQQFWQVLPEEVTPTALVSPPAPSGQSRSWRERLQKVPFLCPRGFIISCRGMATESPALF